MNRSRIFQLVAVSVLLSLVAACGGGSEQSADGGNADPATEGTGSAEAEDSSGEPITVGFLVPLTTANALLGESLKNGLEMAVGEINDAGGVDGRPIELVTSDIGDNNTQAVNALQEVLAQDPIAIVGHAWSTMQVAQNDLVEQAGVPLFYSGSSVNLTDLNNPWAFRITANDDVMAVGAAQYVVEELGIESIGILHSNEEFGIAGRDVIIEVLGERGIEPVGVEAHESAAQDVSAQLLNLRRAGAEIIMGWSFPVPTSLALRQRRELELDTPYLGGRSMALTAVLDLSEPAELDGTYGSVDSVIQVDEAASEWVAEYADAFGKDPDFFSAAYYDIGYMLKGWIEQVGTEPDALREAILATDGYDGVGSNEYNFQDNGESVFKAVVIRYDGDTPEILDVVEISPDEAG